VRVALLKELRIGVHVQTGQRDGVQKKTSIASHRRISRPSCLSSIHFECLRIFSSAAIGAAMANRIRMFSNSSIARALWTSNTIPGLLTSTVGNESG
jgi:hypothetical protein